MRSRTALIFVLAWVCAISGCGKSADQQAKKAAAAIPSVGMAGVEQPPRADSAAAPASPATGADVPAPIRVATSSAPGAPVNETSTATPTRSNLALPGVARDAPKPAAPAIGSVDPRELRAVMPERIGVLLRISATSGLEGGPQGSLARATGQYRSDTASLELKIIDAGNLAEYARTVATWLTTEVDREVDNGYERSGIRDGRRYREIYDGGSRYGEYHVVIGNRFLIELRGTNVEMGTMKQAIGQINVAALEAMKDFGVTK